jgi:hypothetical protein
VRLVVRARIVEIMYKKRRLLVLLAIKARP